MSSWVGDGPPPSSSSSSSSLKKDSLLLGRLLVEQDDDDEEELIFDHTSLLNRQHMSLEGSSSSLCSRACKRLRCCSSNSGSHLQMARTFNLCLSFFALGLCFAIPTATLDDLQRSVDAGQEVKNIYTARYSGYLFGALMGGFLFDRYNRQFLLFLSLLATGVGILVMPFCRALAGLMACTAVTGITMGFLDTGGNVWCLDLWGRRSAPVMQGMHFCFGLGAFLAPLVAEPFLTPHAMSVEVVMHIPMGSQNMYHLGNRNNSNQLHVPPVGLPHNTLGGTHRNNVNVKEPVVLNSQPAYTRNRRSDLNISSIFEDISNTSFKEMNADPTLNQSNISGVVSPSVVSGSKDTGVREDTSKDNNNNTRSPEPSVKEDTLKDNNNNSYSTEITAREETAEYNSTTSLSSEPPTGTHTTNVSTITPVLSTEKVIKKKPEYTDGNPFKEKDHWDDWKPKKDHEGNFITEAPPTNTTAVPKTTTFTTTISPTSETNGTQHVGDPANMTDSSLDTSDDFGNLSISALPLDNGTDSENITTSLSNENLTQIIGEKDSKFEQTTTSANADSVTSPITTTAAFDISSSTISTGTTAKSTITSIPPDAILTVTTTLTISTNPSSSNASLPVSIPSTNSTKTSAFLPTKDTNILVELPTSPKPNLLKHSPPIPATSVASSTSLFVTTTTIVPTETVNESDQHQSNSIDNNVFRNIPQSEKNVKPSHSPNLLGSARKTADPGQLTIPGETPKTTATSPKPTTSGVKSKVETNYSKPRTENNVKEDNLSKKKDDPLKTKNDFDSWEPKYEHDDNVSVSAQPVKSLEEEDSPNELKKESNRSGQTSEDSNTEPSIVNNTEASAKKPSDIFGKFFDLLNQNKLGRFEIPYVLLSVYIFAVALAFLACLCRNPRELRSKQDEELDHSWEPSPSFRVPMVSLMVLFFCLYVGMEVAVGELLETFATKEDLQLSRARGYFLPHLFWGSFAVARGLSICVAMQFSVRCMLLTNLSICLVASIMLVAGADKLEALLWIGIVLLGLGMAPLFPTAISWIEGYLRVTNKMASVFILGAAVGEIVLPTVISVFINQEPMVLMYVNVLVNALCFVCFLILCVMVSRKSLKYAVKPSRTLYQLASMEDTDEGGTELVATNASSPANGHLLPVRRKMMNERPT